MANPTDNLCEVFDIEHSENVVNETAEKIQEVKAGVMEQKYNLEDKEYIRYELQSLIEVNRKVLDTLAEQCKLGCPPRMYEVFSGLSNTIAGNLMELAKLNKMVTDYQVRETDEAMKQVAMEQRGQLLLAKAKQQAPGQGPTLIQNNTYQFASSDLLNMLKELNVEKKKTEIEDLPQFNLE